MWVRLSVRTWLAIRDGLQGWSLVGWAALGVAVMVSTILAWGSEYDLSLPMSVRATARSSLAFFLAAFMSSTLYKVLPGRGGRWLLNNRRYLGLSFAASHAIHAVMVIATAYWLERGHDTATLVGGILGYFLIAAMTVTSFDRTAAWLGPRRWALLHSTGAYLLWAIFTVTYGGGASEQLLHAVFFTLLLACLLLKVGTKLVEARGRR